MAVGVFTAGVGEHVQTLFGKQEVGGVDASDERRSTGAMLRIVAVVLAFYVVAEGEQGYQMGIGARLLG